MLLKGMISMKDFNITDSVEQIFFLIKQQCVYLEKSISEKLQGSVPCFLAFVWKPAWESQVTGFNNKLHQEIDKTRCIIEKGFRGKLEVRFQDVNILSLLFSECDASDAEEYCAYLCDTQGYQSRYCGSPKGGFVGLNVFDSFFAAEQDGEKSSMPLSVTLSYQQNYLVQVVSRDRSEDPEALFLEAVDQAILAHHALKPVDYE